MTSEVYALNAVNDVAEVCVEILPIDVMFDMVAVNRISVTDVTKDDVIEWIDTNPDFYSNYLI